MFSLQDLLGQEQGTQAVGEISQNVGADSSTVNSAIAVALPALINGLANNASTPEGATSLNTALDEDHSGGGVLDNLGGLAGMIFGGGQADAGGILGHILGGSQGQVAQEVSEKSGLGMGQVAQILMFPAPIVMGYLGRQKQSQGAGPDGLLDGLLGGSRDSQPPQPNIDRQISEPQNAAPGNSITDFASKALDRDGDGSSLDDIASMAYKYMTNK